MSTNSSNNSTTAPSDDSKQAVQLLPTEVRCSYPSKLCNCHRAVKDNGDLHKLCDFHRKKANMNQQRMQQRRRLNRQLREKRFMDAQAEDYMMELPICILTNEEIDILTALLFDDEDETAASAQAGCCPMNATYAPSGNMSL